MGIGRCMPVLTYSTPMGRASLMRTDDHGHAIPNHKNVWAVNIEGGPFLAVAPWGPIHFSSPP